jgi:hypothetical protein
MSNKLEIVEHVIMLKKILMNHPDDDITGADNNGNIGVDSFGQKFRCTGTSPPPTPAVVSTERLQKSMFSCKLHSHTFQANDLEMDRQLLSNLFHEDEKHRINHRWQALQTDIG